MISLLITRIRKCDEIFMGLSESVIISNCPKFLVMWYLPCFQSFMCRGGGGGGGQKCGLHMMLMYHYEESPA